MKIRYLIIILIIISINKLKAQDQGTYISKNIVGPNPIASSLAKFAETPVSLFTGTPNISFPLYFFKCGDLFENISIDYDASGIKVEALPTSMGIGWTLNAGGIITRTVRGGTKDFPTENTFLPLSGNSVEDDFFDVVSLSGTHDPEPDIFYYNFNGYSGSFYLHNRNVVLKKHDDIKIELVMNGISICGFKCTTTAGALKF